MGTSLLLTLKDIDFSSPLSEYQLSNLIAKSPKGKTKNFKIYPEDQFDNISVREASLMVAIICGTVQLADLLYDFRKGILVDPIVFKVYLT
jgi:hypothetical protein